MKRVFLVVLLWTVTAGLLLSQLLDRVEYYAYDFLLANVGPQHRLDSSLCMIGVDDASLDALGMWPWPRSVHAELLGKLGGARCAVFDVVFDAHGSGDDELARQLKRFGKAVLAYRQGYREGALRTPDEVPLPQFASSAALGFINVDDSAGQVRRTRLAARDASGACHPSLDLAALSLARGQPIVYGSDEIRVGDMRIPTDRNYEILIPYFSGNSGQRNFFTKLLEPIPYARVLGRKLPAKYDSSNATAAPDLKDAVCLIGIASADLRSDIHSTPVGEVLGLDVHAQIMNTLLTQCWLRETPAWLYLLMVVGMPLALGWRLARMSAWQGLALAAVSLLALWVVTAVAFQHGWWIRSVAPSVMMFLAAGIAFCYQFQRGYAFIDQLVAPEIARKMLSSDASGIEDKVVTILFSDIRGYTTLTETMAPADMMALLNEYHTLTIDIYTRNGGRCVSYLGDAQMVIFGAPLERPDHALCAVRAACQVQEALVGLEQRWKQRNLLTFEVGIGICTGQAALGFVGSKEHKEYTAIGDATNTAARLQALSRELSSPILVSEETVRQAGDLVVSEPLQPVLLKGKTQKVMVYRVSRCKSASPPLRAATALLLLGALLGNTLGCSAPPPALTSPAPSPSASSSLNSLDMPLPIYPEARKQADTRFPMEDKQVHMTLVLVSSDSAEKVAEYYRHHMKSSLIMNKNRTVTFTEARSGAADHVNTVVVQPMAGGTQITLSAYLPLPR